MSKFRRTLCLIVLSIFISTSFVHAGVISKTVKVGVADVVIKKVAQKGIEKGVDKYGKVLAAEIAARQVAEQNANNNNKSKGSSDDIASSAGQQASASAGGSGKKNNDDDDNDNDDFTKARGEKVDVAGKMADNIAKAEQIAGTKMPTQITDYSKHGLNQAISRDGVGVSPQAILDAIKNPVKIAGQSGGRFVFTGKDAVVVVNSDGKIITTWAKNAAGVRLP